MNKIKLGLIFGGQSAEHDVSIMSIRSVLKVIDYEKYDITLFYITKYGQWILFDDEINTIQPASYEKSKVYLSENILNALNGLDVVFPVVHGPQGEDGSLQGLFEVLNKPYVGSKVLGSAVCMDKIISKKIMKQVGLSAVDYFEFYESITDEKIDELLNWIKTVGYPVFVKPSNMGSSVGISKVYNDSTLRVALEKALSFDKRVLIEEGINAREIECAVLESDEILVSGVGEVLASNDFYDYEAKYTDDGQEKMMVPAMGVPDGIVEKIRQFAKEAFLAHGCKGFARIDFFLEKETNRIILNELNTIPGMTAFSMYPVLFEKAGIGYRELIDKLIKNAIDHV